MQLITMHKILMRTAISAGALFTAWSLHAWSNSAQTSSLIMAAVSAALTVGMLIYLRRFTRATTAPDAE